MVVLDMFLSSGLPSWAHSASRNNILSPEVTPLMSRREFHSFTSQRLALAAAAVAGLRNALTAGAGAALASTCNTFR